MTLEKDGTSSRKNAYYDFALLFLLYMFDYIDRLVIVSEPLDRAQPGWREVPRSCVLTARKGAAPALECMDEAISRAAA